MRVDVNSLGLVDQALISLFLGFGLALLNVIIRYFANFVPRVVTVLGWKKPASSWTRLLITAYAIALVFQVVTSPIFRSVFSSVYVELAWSPYQALWNILGIVLMDVIVLAWNTTRKGVEIGGQQLQELKSHASETLEDLGAQLPLSAESREATQERRQEVALEEQSARKQRIDDRLKDY